MQQPAFLRKASAFVWRAVCRYYFIRFWLGMDSSRDEIHSTCEKASPMKKKATVKPFAESASEQAEGDAFRNGQLPSDRLFPSLLCQQCGGLDDHIRYLDMEIKKLEGMEKLISEGSRQNFKERALLVRLPVEFITFSVEDYKTTIHQLQQHLNSISTIAQKQSELLSKFDNVALESSTQSLGKVQQPKKQELICPNAEQLEQGLKQILQSTDLREDEKEKSQLSGSLTSEHKSMIEKMTQQQRQAYYTKNVKSRKMMAKLKKKK